MMAADKDEMEVLAEFMQENTPRQAATLTEGKNNVTYSTTIIDDFTEKCNIKFINPVATPEARQRYTLDDKGTALLFADTFRSVLCAIRERQRDKWQYYDGKVWVQDKGNVFVNQAMVALANFVNGAIPPVPTPEAKFDDMGQRLSLKTPADPFEHYRKYYRRLGALKTRTTIIKDAETVASLARSMTEFDTRPELLNLQNGTFNLDTCTLQPHSPEDCLSMIADVAFDPQAESETFNRFLDDIFLHNKEDRALYMQKALGYSLYGLAREQCFFLLYGPTGRNGKGVLTHTVENLLGSYAASMDFNTIAKAGAVDGSRATPDLARLRGKRFVAASEPQKGVFYNEALVKMICGNDPIPCRNLYEGVIEFRPQFVLFISCNSKPSVADDSLFNGRRPKLVLFERHITEAEQDSGLEQKLSQPYEKSAVLNWLIMGYELYKVEGLKDTKEMNRTVKQYRDENDIVGQFLKECVDFGNDNRTKISTLRSHYAQWCNYNGHHSKGLKEFKADLEGHKVDIIEYGHTKCVMCTLKPLY